MKRKKRHWRFLFLFLLLATPLSESTDAILLVSQSKYKDPPALYLFLCHVYFNHGEASIYTCYGHSSNTHLYPYLICIVSANVFFSVLCLFDEQ